MGFVQSTVRMVKKEETLTNIMFEENSSTLKKPSRLALKFASDVLEDGKK
jgi:hypothetical protein